MFLCANNVSFGYSFANTVLQDLSFSLPKESTLAIVGASGCGKSTLLRLISGILPGSGQPLTGSITIDGKTPDQYRKSGKMSFMFQEATLMPNLSVFENLIMPLKIKRDNDLAFAYELLEAVGLNEFENYLPKELSGGMKTRVSLARAFVTKPELLLLDEPFSALDIGWKSNLYKSLTSLFATTKIIVTHDVQEAILLADKIIVLGRNGCIQKVFDVDSALSSSERICDIPGFLKSDTFNKLNPLLQNAIILKEDAVTTNSNNSELSYKYRFKFL